MRGNIIDISLGIIQKINESYLGKGEVCLGFYVVIIILEGSNEMRAGICRIPQCF